MTIGAASQQHGGKTIVGTLVAAVVTFALASCGQSSSGMGRLTFNGQVLLASAHGTLHSAKSGAALHTGDRIQVSAGSAEVSLAGGTLSLRTGTELTIDTAPHLTAGAMLIRPGEAGLRVAAERATLSVPSGVAQLAVARGTADLTAKVYQATSEMDIPGNPPADISAPRQIVLTTATHLPVSAAPLVYQDSDGWDRQYLSATVAISSQLAAAEAGFNAQLAANQGKDASFYLQLLPALSGRADFPAAFSNVERADAAGSSPAHKPGDYLIASVIALRGSGGSLTARLADELTFAAQGASWGFVAYDQGVTDLSGVVSDVLSAIGRAALPFTGAPASQIAIGPPTTTPPTTRPPSHAVTTAPPTTTPTVPPRPGGPRPPATTTTTTSPPLIHIPVPVLPGPLGSLLNPLLDPLIQALNNLLSGKH